MIIIENARSNYIGHHSTLFSLICIIVILSLIFPLWLPEFELNLHGSPLDDATLDESYAQSLVASVFVCAPMVIMLGGQVFLSYRYNKYWFAQEATAIPSTVVWTNFNFVLVTIFFLESAYFLYLYRLGHPAALETILCSAVEKFIGLASTTLLLAVYSKSVAIRNRLLIVVVLMGVSVVSSVHSSSPNFGVIARIVRLLSFVAYTSVFFMFCGKEIRDRVQDFMSAFVEEISSFKWNDERIDHLKLFVFIFFVPILIVYCAYYTWPGLNKDSTAQHLIGINLIVRVGYTLLVAFTYVSPAESRDRLQRQRSLLNDMLPEYCINTILNGDKVQPLIHNNICVLFSDIQGFTAFSKREGPIATFNMLDQLYCMMDIVAKHVGVFKIETIGDAYVCTAGLNTPNGDPRVNAEKIAKFALLVQKFSNVVILKNSADSKLRERVVLRVGVHIGSIVTGIVGELNPRFCLFGGTVNKTSRLESTGEGGKIHISSEIFEILRDHPHFRLECGGKVYMKGLGDEETYWLEASKHTCFCEEELAFLLDKILDAISVYL